jgi:solute carrier family 25 carnitine/acylcarnitine transporter 20/29
MQKSVSDRQFKGPIDCAHQLVRSQGVFGLWSVFVPHFDCVSLLTWYVLAGFSGGLLFRANFFYMFLTFEVDSSQSQHHLS